MDTIPARRKRDEKAKAVLEEKLKESGDRERLRKFLYDKLIDCGFKDRLAQQCQDILKDRGLKNTSIDYLVDTVTPKAREDVPAEIKAEFLEKLRRIVYEDDDNTEDEEEDDGHKDRNDKKDEAK